MNEWTSGHFKIKKLDLDLVRAKQDCFAIYETVKYRYGNFEIPADGPAFTNLSTRLFFKYNTFLFSSQELHKLFVEISNFWKIVRPTNEPWYLRSWVNIYDSSKSIGWHSHFESKDNGWHGYFCVDVDQSKTSYALFPPLFQESLAYEHDYVYNNTQLVEHNTEYELANVCGQDNFLFMSPSGPMHRNVPWRILDRPRITIAFDILPGRFIDNSLYENHWIPLV
jgi:hypothetical protein